MAGAREYRMVERGERVRRTRERVVAVAREALLTEPYDHVTLTRVAATAGVTQQTVLNQFASKEGLLMEVVQVLAGEVDDLRGPVVRGDVDGAARSLVRQYEVLGDANVRFVALAERSPEIAGAIGAAREAHRSWLVEVFDDRLPAGPGSRRRRLAALYAVTDVGTWKLLRRDLGISRRESTTIIASLITAVLDGTG